MRVTFARVLFVGSTVTRVAVGVAAIGALTVGETVSVSAHHAFSAEFDSNKPVQFSGTVIRMEWVNPHVWMHLNVKTKDGKTENWAFEAGSPNALFRRGFTKQSLLPGTKVVIYGYQAKDGSRRANGRDVTFPDGRKLFVGSSGTGAPYELTPGDQKAPTR